MATYTGQVVEFDKTLNSGLSIQSAAYAWDTDMPSKPDANGYYAAAVPGVTKYIS